MPERAHFTQAEPGPETPLHRKRDDQHFESIEH